MRAIIPFLTVLAACATLSTGRRPPPARPPAHAPEAAPEQHRWVADVALPAHVERPDPETEQAIAEAIRELASEDFEDYSTSARRLVSAGVPAVPYLGYASEREPRDERLRKVVPIVLKPILQACTPAEVGGFLESPYALVRLSAARAAGERGLGEHAAGLVNLLEDEEVEVRQAGVTALRRISQRFYGFRADGSAAARQRAVAKWRVYVLERA